jgi:hypothetical protein
MPTDYHYTDEQSKTVKQYFKFIEKSAELYDNVWNEFPDIVDKIRLELSIQSYVRFKSLIREELDLNIRYNTHRLGKQRGFLERIVEKYLKPNQLSDTKDQCKTDLVDQKWSGESKPVVRENMLDLYANFVKKTPVEVRKPVYNRLRA